MRSLETATEVVDALGGIKAVAALTDRKYNAAANWPAFGKFPPNTFLVMRKALEAAKCEAPASLWGMVGAEAAE